MNVSEIVTVQHLQDFKKELIEEIKILVELKNQPQRKWLKRNETLAFLQISSNTLLNLRKLGKIKYKKLGGIFYYDVQQLNTTLEETK